MAWASGKVSRMPLSSSINYLLIGYGLGPRAAAILNLDVFRDSAFIEAITTVVIVISIFGGALMFSTGDG